MGSFMTGQTLKRIVLVLAAMALAVIALGTLLLPGNGQRTGAQIASRPNIVVVMTDDLDEQSMEQLGGIRNVMGTNGTTFENAFVSYALCCPSRSTFLRGQYAHNHGVTSGSNLLGEPRFRELGLDQSTIATWLNDAGYQTKYLGKYLNGYKGPYIPRGWDEWFAFTNPASDNVVVNSNGQEVSLAGNSTDVFADEISDFITRSSAKPDPFFVMVGTRAPHRPVEIAERYSNSFANTPLPRPENFGEEFVSDKPQWVQSYPRLTQTKIDQLQQEYRGRLRSMLPVKDLLDQTITTLQQTGELDNTYIFFTSDNGFHLGNHRIAPGGKRTPYEEDIGVPLMVRGPGVPAGDVRNQLVVNTDFAPTLADLADIPIPTFVDGSSFAPLLTSTLPSSWRTAFLQESWRDEDVFTSRVVPTNAGVRTGTHMYVEYETAEQELYDLGTDPYQMESLPQADNQQLYSQMQARLDALRACSGATCRAHEWNTQVISTIPKANATAVAPTSNIKANFSEDMMSSSITSKTFKLLENGTTTKVAATVSYDASTDTATLDPTNSLRSGVTYKAIVTTGAKDVAGNPLDQNPTKIGLQQNTWLFTVSP
jgi:N-acetylglucosamine-6-sulfatase